MYELVVRAKAWKDAGGNADAFVTHVPGSPGQKGQATVSDRPPSAHVRYKTVATPSVAFATGNPYLDRPLPAPPLRKVTIMERPRTSSGPSSKTQTGSDFSKLSRYDKRVSRDDLYLSMKPGARTGSRRPEYATFHGQPTPEGSPRTRSNSRPLIPTIRLPTPELTEDVPEAIGMALGSPTHQPKNWGSSSPQPQQKIRPELVQASHSTSPLSTVENADSFQVPKEKKQLGRRKLFGLFGRSNTFSQGESVSKPNAQDRAYQPSQINSKSPQEARPLPARSNTSSDQKMPKHKSIFFRSQTASFENGSHVSAGKSTGFRSRNPSLGTSRNSPVPYERNPSKSGNPNVMHKPLAQSSGPMKGLLNVDIPQSTLERYSVMFQDVLDTQPSSSSALLARRQATIKELKKISDAAKPREDEQLARPRRATSPQPTRSPRSFVLFPPAPSGRQSVTQTSRPPSRLTRANTSPAMLPSPSKDSFDIPTQPQEGDSSSPLSQIGRSAISTAAKAGTQPAMPHGFRFGPETSGFVMESPTDMDSPTLVPDIIRSNTVRPKIQEPQWQIIEPSGYTISAESSATSSRKRSPSSASSSAQTHLTKPSFDLDDISIDGAPASPISPVEISIARQISISRQQHKMLRPLQTSFASARPRQSPVSGSPLIPRIAMGKNERLVETRTNTPTLVTPDANFDTQLAQHRKSERIILEG